MVCKFCGKILEDGSKFCNGCGGMLSEMPSPSEKKAPLDSLINDIDSMEIDENGDFVTVAYTENSEIDATVPITALDDEKVEYNPVNKPSTPTDNGNGSNNKKNNTPIIVAAVAIVVAIIMLIVAVVAIFGSSPSNEVDDDTTTEVVNEDITIDVETEPETETSSETTTEKETTSEKETETTTKAEVSTETVQREIDNALNSGDIRQVEKVIAKYMPVEDDSVYRTYTPQQKVILNTLIDFYDTVIYELDSCDFGEPEFVCEYLNELYGDIVVDYDGYMQYPWEIGDTMYAVSNDVYNHHDKCFDKILECEENAY